MATKYKVKAISIKRKLINNFATVGGFFLDNNVDRDLIHRFHVSLHCENHEDASLYCGNTRVTVTMKLGKLYKQFPDFKSTGEPYATSRAFLSFVDKKTHGYTPKKEYTIQTAEQLHINIIADEDVNCSMERLILYLKKEITKFHTEEQKVILSQISSRLIKQTSTDLGYQPRTRK